MRRVLFGARDELPAAAAAAAEVTAGGGVVMVPTESYYGLGADPRNPDAVARIFAAKGRPGDRALPVVCCDWQQVESLVSIPDRYRVRLGRIWPAALTVVAGCREPIAAAGGATLAVRVPGHAMLRALLYRVGPLTATSANRHGAPPCTSVDRALESLAVKPELVLDAGRLAGGEVSTVVDLTGDAPVILRRGPVAWDQLFDPETESVHDL